MGLLVNGIWQDSWYDTKSTGGAFVRQDSQFRNWVTAEGETGFKAEAGRYHLYVSLACPWACRTLIYRRLKGLEALIPVSVVHWHMGSEGWHFSAAPGVVPDTVNGAQFLHQIYTRANPAYTGRVTVPVLWDKQRQTIVNNESSEIIRIFNGAFDHVGAKPGDYYPAPLRAEIGELNARIYDTVNNGVYKAGFATSQAAYERAVRAVFESLDWLEDRLSRNRFLLGASPLECDWRLFTTLVRFDPVYAGHFKCNIRRLVDYPNLWAYTRDLYQWPGIAETVDLFHIKHHYYQSHTTINPTGIVPMGPDFDLTAPPGRG